MYCHGDHGEVVNAPGCGPGIRGFDSRWSPHFFYVFLTIFKININIKI